MCIPLKYVFHCVASVIAFGEMAIFLTLGAFNTMFWLGLRKHKDEFQCYYKEGMDTPLPLT